MDAETVALKDHLLVWAGDRLLAVVEILSRRAEAPRPVVITETDYPLE